MDRERQVIDKIKQVLDKVGHDLIGYRVVLFGSRACGAARERSDFDIGILGPQKLALRAFYRIYDLLDEIDTLYSIDLVDMSDVSESFRSEALLKTEVLYG